MQTYTHYKDSGIDWIGQIPEHWEVKKVKEICSMNGRIGFRGYSQSDLVSEGEGAITISPSNIVENQMNFDKNTYLSWEKYFESPEIMVSNDDILIVKTGSTVGKVGIVKNLNIEATINPQLLVIKNIKTNIQFTYEYLHSNIFYDFVKSNAIGSTIPTISETKIGNLPIIYPPIHEQEAIAKFLDDKTAKIDALVQTKEQQIEKLKELRQAKIHQAVSKGIPCHAELVEASSKTHALSKVEMKDSGVEWIGEIPAHWEVRRLATLGNFSKGGGFSKADLVEENGVSAILYGDIYTKYNYIIKESVRLISNTAASNAIVLEFDDLLFTGSGETKEDIGKCVAFKSKTITVAGGDVIIFKQISNSSNYLSYCLNTEGAKFEKAKSSKGEIIVHTYASKLKEISVPIPPIQEQEQIVTYLDEVTGKIDQAIAQKQEQITKLKEYKQSLINDVVTGKIKVC